MSLLYLTVSWNSFLIVGEMCEHYFNQFSEAFYTAAQ